MDMDATSNAPRVELQQLLQEEMGIMSITCNCLEYIYTSSYLKIDLSLLLYFMQDVMENHPTVQACIHQEMV